MKVPKGKKGLQTKEHGGVRPVTEISHKDAILAVHGHYSFLNNHVSNLVNKVRAGIGLKMFEIFVAKR